MTGLPQRSDQNPAGIGILRIQTLSRLRAGTWARLLQGLLLCTLVASSLVGCDESTSPQPSASFGRPSVGQPSVGHPAIGKPALEQLSAAQQAVVARTRVPVLLPTARHLRRAAILTGELDWFAASIKDEDVVITMEGNLSATDAPEIRKAFKGYPVGTRNAPRIGHNELILEAAWLEDDIAWSVEISCMHPDTHPRCVKTDYVLALVRGLRPVAQAQP